MIHSQFILIISCRFENPAQRSQSFNSLSGLTARPSFRVDFQTERVSFCPRNTGTDPKDFPVRRNSAGRKGQLKHGWRGQLNSARLTRTPVQRGVTANAEGPAKAPEFQDGPGVLFVNSVTKLRPPSPKDTGVKPRKLQVSPFRGCLYLLPQPGTEDISAKLTHSRT